MDEKGIERPHMICEAWKGAMGLGFIGLKAKNPATRLVQLRWRTLNPTPQAYDVGVLGIRDGGP